uniref:Uncharacterized protein n=1 Tax=Heterorhabditis bacteriophora TaxID=37862 RepID=A0A1I7WB70_HETBA
MVGPARDEDQTRKVGPGILLPYTQPNFSWEEIRRHKGRMKRALSTTISPEDNSYEEIEYVEDEEEVVEKEEHINHLESGHVQIPHLFVLSLNSIR